MNTTSVERLSYNDYFILYVINVLSPASAINIIFAIFLFAYRESRVIIAAISCINMAFTLLNKRRVCARFAAR